MTNTKYQVIEKNKNHQNAIRIQLHVIAKLLLINYFTCRSEVQRDKESQV